MGKENVFPLRKEKGRMKNIEQEIRKDDERRMKEKMEEYRE